MINSKVLLAGIPEFCDFFQKKLSDYNMDSIAAHDVDSALEILFSMKIDLVVTNMVFPDMGGFVLIQKMQEYKLLIPYIMLTPCEQVSDYIGLAYDYDVGYILNKTNNHHKIINTVRKMINQDQIVDFQHYLHIDAMDEVNEVDVWDSQQAQDIATDVTAFAIDAKMHKEKIRSLRLVFDEIAHNAIYHAHGLKREKKLGIPVTLPKEKKIQIKYALDNEKMAVAVTDFEGKLTLTRVLKSLKDILDNNERMFRAIKQGDDFTTHIQEDGRGFQIAIDTSDEFYINIQPDYFTQIIFLIWLEPKNQPCSRHSLHIRELAQPIANSREYKLEKKTIAI